MDLIVTILAGGRGKRMQSDTPKVLHKINNMCMIVRIISQVVKLSPYKILIVVPQDYQLIKDAIDRDVEVGKQLIQYVIQPTALGTGDAVRCTLKYMSNNSNNLIICGDTPLISYDTLSSVVRGFTGNIQITGIELDNPYGYGRLVCNDEDVLVRIVEEKDCNDSERMIKYGNVGIIMAAVSVLNTVIPQLETNNKANEYYLTDIVKFHPTNLHLMDKSKLYEITNVNTPEDLLVVNNVVGSI